MLRYARNDTLCVFSYLATVPIKKTFAAWRTYCPQILLTDDDLRGLEYPKELEKRVKPSPFLFDLIHAQWLDKDKGKIIIDINQLDGILKETRQRMMY